MFLDFPQKVNGSQSKSFELDLLPFTFGGQCNSDLSDNQDITVALCILSAHNLVLQ